MPEKPVCPACGGPGMLIGYLGMLIWFRCRNCGIEFNRPVSDQEWLKRPNEMTQ